MVTRVLGVDPGSSATGWALIIADGNHYRLSVSRSATGTLPVTFIASDATAGNSYTAKRVNLVVAPTVHAHISCDTQTGKAPFTLKVSADGSRAPGKPEFGWEFYEPKPKRKAAPEKVEQSEAETPDDASAGAIVPSALGEDRPSTTEGTPNPSANTNWAPASSVRST